MRGLVCVARETARRGASSIQEVPLNNRASVMLLIEVALLLKMQQPVPHPRAYFMENDGRQKIVSADAALACQLVAESGLNAASAVLAERSNFDELQCCLAHCATRDCASIERVDGMFSQVIECGACPQPSTQPSSGCWRGSGTC